MVRILVIDDHPIIAQALIQMLPGKKRFKVLGNAINYQEALEKVQELSPDLVVVDIGLRSEKNGLELVKELSKKYPDLKSMVLSMHDEDVYANRAFNAGALAYINKSEFTEKIVAAIEHVVAGQTFFPGGGYKIDAHNDKLKHYLARLSDRELEVFRCIGLGTSNDELAKLLQLKEKTIHSHRLRIRNKLQLQSNAELFRLAKDFVSNDDL